METTHLKLLYANTEKDVDEIIQSHPGMKDAGNWHPVDGRDTNFNTIGNQSQNGGKAATELITNMVDSMLTKDCLERGIDPKSERAPKTMYDAAGKIMSISGGRIIDGDKNNLRDYAKGNLIIGIVGSRSGEVRPCYVFCDNGEGQHPDKFKTTFLSLTAKNKSKISFVQGKYNMGSSGVLRYCGSMWYKLIISRRYDGTGEWGWTLIRKQTPQDGGLRYAEYYAPGGKIETVGAEQIFPFKVQSGDTYESFSLKTGAIIKLYEYYTGKDAGFRGARDAFNENLVETILPFRILDFRQTPDHGRGKERGQGIDARSLYGLEYLYVYHRDVNEDDESVSTEDNKPVQDKPIQVDDIENPQLGKIAITAIKLSAGKGTGIRGLKGRVFHHVNGQVQFKQTRGFLTDCKLSALKDRVVIFVNASGLTDDAHMDIWKGDRENIAEHPLGELYKKVIKESIIESDILKEWNHQITKEELDSVAKDSSRELVKDIVKNDKNLALLLDDSVPEGVRIHRKPSEQQQRTDLLEDPTYIDLSGNNREFSITKNKGCRIVCDTDARDDFFTRTKNIGKLSFSEVKSGEKFHRNANLKNGKLSVRIDAVGNVDVGDEYKFKFALQSDDMSDPVQTDEITIKVVSPIPHDVDEKKKISRTKKGQKGLPDYKLCTKDGRDIDENPTKSFAQAHEHCNGFDEKDGGYVFEGDDEKKVYWINYDNTSFQNYLASQKSEADKKMASEKYILGMRILMLGLEYALEERKKARDKDTTESDHDPDFRDEFRRISAKGAATVVLTLCHQLPKTFKLNKDDETGDN